eukprot:13397139-Alexandrium_andersonii.AAC.1
MASSSHIGGRLCPLPREPASAAPLAVPLELVPARGTISEVNGTRHAGLEAEAEARIDNGTSGEGPILALA